MKEIAFAVLYVSLLPVLTYGSAQESELKWRKYANSRFGFVLTYPGTLIAGEEAGNGGGREFHSADGEFSLAAFAHFFVRESGDSFEKRWQEELETPDVTITYKKKDAHLVSRLRSDQDWHGVLPQTLSKRGELGRLPHHLPACPEQEIRSLGYADRKELHSFSRRRLRSH